MVPIDKIKQPLLSSSTRRAGWLANHSGLWDFLMDFLMGFLMGIHGKKGKNFKHG